jgi:hypothetical protein
MTNVVFSLIDSAADTFYSRLYITPIAYPISYSGSLVIGDTIPLITNEQVPSRSVNLVPNQYEVRCVGWDESFSTQYYIVVPETNGGTINASDITTGSYTTGSWITIISASYAGHAYTASYLTPTNDYKVNSIELSEIKSSTILDSIIIVNPPFNMIPTITFAQDPNGSYYGDGAVYTFTVYSFKYINGVNVYSDVGITFSGNIPNDQNSYVMEFSWTTIPLDGGVEPDGFKILIISDQGYGAYADYYLNTSERFVMIGYGSAGYEYYTEGSYNYESPLVITPSSPYYEYTHANISVASDGGNVSIGDIPTTEKVNIGGNLRVDGNLLLESNGSIDSKIHSNNIYGINTLIFTPDPADYVDSTFAIQRPILMSDGIAMASVNSSNTANTSMELRASNFRLSPFATGVGINKSPAYALDVAGAIRSDTGLRIGSSEVIDSSKNGIFNNVSCSNLKVSGGYNAYTGSYFMGYDTGSYQIASTTTVYSMSLSTTALNSSGITVSGSTKTMLKVASAGVYNIQFSAQFFNTNNTTEDIYIWFRKNNNDIAWSNTKLTVPASKTSGHSGSAVAAWNYVDQAATNDYYQICYSGTNTTLYLQSQTGLTSPTRPSIPCLLVSIVREDMPLITYT